MKNLLSITILLILSVGCTPTTMSIAGTSDPNDSKINLSEAKAKPIIVWFHTGTSSKIESLENVLSSELVTHVIMLYMHRKDKDLRKSPNVRQAIKMVKESDAKLIWCRDLWPYYANDTIRLAHFFDVNYYIQEIQALRAEAREIGADFAALDTEPYGRSPFKKYLKSKFEFSPKQLDSLKAAVAQAVKTAGQVDFILPAGSARPDHPYYTLADLGKFKLAEYTYYNKKRNYEVTKKPHEGFGPYVNIARNNVRNPK